MLEEEKEVLGLYRIDDAYHEWHGNADCIKTLEKQTVEDLIREAFFSGYEKGVCAEKARGN